MEKPDKVSVALMLGILCLIVLNAGIIYNTWIRNEDRLDAMQAQKMENELVFHDDTSITNNSPRTLWLRVRVIYRNEEDAASCRIVSRALDDGCWMQEQGWYYYQKPISEDESTKPLLDSLLWKGRDVMREPVRNFRLQAEAVDEQWLSAAPRSGQEAFQLFNDLDQAGEDLYL